MSAILGSPLSTAPFSSSKWSGFSAGVERFLEGYAGPVGNEAGDAVYLVERHAQRAAHVANRRLGAHRAKGNDLADTLAAVFLDDEVHYLLPAFVVEIDVDIRRGDPLGVQESLEQQAVGHGVYVDDADRVGHHAARRRAAARPHVHAALAGFGGELLHDEEVARVAHLLDNAEFALDPLRNIGRDFAVFFFRALPGQMGQVLVLRLEAFGDFEDGQNQVAGQVEFEVAFVGDFYGIGQRLGVFGEYIRHFVPGLEIELRVQLVIIVGKAEPVFAVIIGVGLEGQQEVVRLAVGLVDVMHVVGGDGLHAVFLRPFEQDGVAFVLQAQSVVLQLYVIVLAEKLYIPAEEFFGGFVVARAQ